MSAPINRSLHLLFAQHVQQEVIQRSSVPLRQLRAFLVLRGDGAPLVHRHALAVKPDIFNCHPGHQLAPVASSEVGLRR